MPSERIQRRIDQLLGRAEAACDAGAWTLAAELCRQVVTLDGENVDALPLLALAERGLSGAVDSVPPASMPAPPAPPPLPASFASGRYEVLGLLGEGGKKVVYRAHDSQLDRDVAFALIKTDGLNNDERERVTREARTLGRLSSHPNIVTVFEIGDEAGQPYLVTELMAGGDVAQRISESPDHRLPLPLVVQIGTAVCKALAFVHDKGVVHRDLKPGNIWLADDGAPKLGDFGLAVGLDRARLTQVGMMVGTALYMAPEQAMGQTVTPRSDLYSLGCVLYELVTGRPPFVGDEQVAIIGQHLNANPVAPSWYRPDCPKALETLILRLLEKDPAKRPASAAEVVEALATIGAAPARTPSQPAPAVAPPSGSANPVYRRIFVGREAELRQLEAAFDAAVSGQGGLVMVVGEPGIGKTTLTEQLSTYAALRGGRTLVGHCYEEGSLSLPYLPFVEAMRSYVLEREPEQLKRDLGNNAPDVARIVSEVRDLVQVSPSAPSADPGEDRFRLLNAVASFLRNAASVQPLVIVLEDLHDADRGTLELLQHLARQLQGARLLIVGTYRDVEVDRTHPLSGTVAELRRGGRLERIALRGLTADEVQRMLSAIAGQEVQWALAEAVHRQTEGNPLFVQEVLRYLAEEGLITREEGRWRAGGSTPLLETIPEGLRDVIGKRLSRLSPECNRLLAVAAVIGRDFGLATLLAVARPATGDRGLAPERASQTSDDDEDVVVAALDEALKVAVLQDTSRPGSVRYRFAHAFFRQTLYEELITPRRLRLHQQVARALEAQYAGRLDEHAVELAEHFAQSSDPAELAKAVAYGTRAARRALAVYAYGEAVRLFDQALAVQEVLDPDDASTRFELLQALAEALPAAGESLRAFEQAAPAAFALAEQLSDRSRAWRTAHAALTALRWYGDISIMFTHPASGQWAERCAAYATPGTREQVLADVWLAQVFLAGTSDRRKAMAARRRAWALANELDDAEAWSAAAQAAMAAAAENVEAALAVAQAVAARPRTGLGSATAGDALLRASQVLLSWGRREVAEALLREVRGIAERASNARLRLGVEGFELGLLVIDGRLQDVLAGPERLIEHGDALGLAQSGRQIAHILQLRPLWLLGRYEDALAANRDWMRFQDHDPASAGPVALAVDALALAHLGRMEEAATELRDFGSRFGEPDEFSNVQVTSYILEADVLLEDRPRVALLAALLVGAAAMALTGPGGACPARLLGDAMRFLGEPEQALAYYAQALETAGSIGFRPEVALARLGLAALFAEGDTAEQQEAREHLSFVMPEFEAMEMQPALERALALRNRMGGQIPAPLTAGGETTAVAAEAAPVAPPARRQIFISYARADRGPALGLAAALEAEGLQVWIDRHSIAGGAGWNTEIVRGIKGCAVFVVLGSARAFDSPNVQRELNLAVEENRPVLPLLLEPVQAPDEVRYALAGRQWLEVLDQPADVWLPQVLTAIERLQ
jgi:predicted ATPase